MIYINFQGPAGRETVDELDSKDFKTYREYLKEARRLVSEYQLAGMDVYASSRKCKNWS